MKRRTLRWALSIVVLLAAIIGLWATFVSFRKPMPPEFILANEARILPGMTQAAVEARLEPAPQNRNQCGPALNYMTNYRYEDWCITVYYDGPEGKVTGKQLSYDGPKPLDPILDVLHW